MPPLRLTGGKFFITTAPQSFLRCMASLDADAAAHNSAYVETTLVREMEYFDNIVKEIAPAIQPDDKQQRAVITDDDHCLLVAGAGAGKNTTMAAKVKYLVERKRIRPEEIIVISYTNKAIDELKERINTELGIPAKICTFHAFAFEIIRRLSAQSPDVNYASYQIISDLLEQAIFQGPHLMRKLVLFFWYYFDLTEDAFQFENLEQYHLLEQILNIIHAADVRHLQKFMDFLSPGIFFWDVILSGYMKPPAWCFYSTPCRRFTQSLEQSQYPVGKQKV